MEISLGKKLSKEKYEELVKGTTLEVLSLDELVDIAIDGDGMNEVSNGQKFWEYAGAYYRYNKENNLVISIDREQTVGGYNNSELTIEFLNKMAISSNKISFIRLISQRIAEKQTIKTL